MLKHYFFILQTVSGIRKDFNLLSAACTPTVLPHQHTPASNSERNIGIRQSKRASARHAGGADSIGKIGAFNCGGMCAEDSGRQFSLKEICRWLILHLPFIRHEICRWPAAHLPIANFQFADGKVKVCHRQVSRWPTVPSANFLFAIGKFFICHRQIC